MNRKEFMSRLEGLLWNVSPGEREEALQYYDDYFDDAGEENEQAVIETLGAPEKIAETIRRELQGEENARRVSGSNREVIPWGEAEPEKTEAGDGRYGGREAGERGYGGRGFGEPAGDGSVHEPPRKKAKGMSGGVIVLLVVLALLALPIGLPVILGALGTLFGMLAAWFAMIFSFGVAAAALLGVLLLLIILGGMCVMLNPFVGLALWGCGLICGGLGLLLLMLTVAMAGIATPAMFRGIAWIFGRRGREKRS